MRPIKEIFQLKLYGKKLNNRGQSITEAIVGFGLVTLIGSTFIGGVVSLGNISQNTQSISDTNKQIKTIIENIRAGVEGYQINYEMLSDPLSLEAQMRADSVLPYKQLPMAWDYGITALVADCSKCAGRFGYIIRPMDQYRGLYMVMLKMNHLTWDEKNPQFPNDPTKNTKKYRIYSFLVSVK